MYYPQQPCIEIISFLIKNVRWNADITLGVMFNYVQVTLVCTISSEDGSVEHSVVLWDKKSFLIAEEPIRGQQHNMQKACGNYCIKDSSISRGPTVWCNLIYNEVCLSKMFQSNHTIRSLVHDNSSDFYKERCN